MSLFNFRPGVSFFLDETTADGSKFRFTVSRKQIWRYSRTLLHRWQMFCHDSYYLYVLSCKKPGCMKQYRGLTSRPTYIRYGIVTSPVPSGTAQEGTGEHCGARGIYPSGETTDKWNNLQTWPILITMRKTFISFICSISGLVILIILLTAISKFYTVFLFQNFMNISLKMLKVLKIWKNI